MSPDSAAAMRTVSCAMRRDALRIVLLFGVSLGLDAGGGGARSQCPSVCVCNATAIACRGGRLASADIFHQISPTVWTELASLEVSGGNGGEAANAFGDLSGQNLFGVNAVHRAIEVLNVSNDAITAIDDKTFEGLPNIQVLDISHNRLSRIGGDVLTRAVRLRKLHMRDAISAGVNDTAAADMLHTLLAQSDNDFAELDVLVLDANNLVYLKPDTFCRLKGLDRLSLRNNDLASLAMSPTCRPGPRYLDLSGNDLQYVSDTTVHTWSMVLIHLEEADFSANPWACDCLNAQLLTWMQRNSDLFVNKANTLCHVPSVPAEFEQQSIFEIDVAALQCASEAHGGGTHSFYVLLLVLLLLTAIVFAACAFARWRKSMAAAMDKPYRGVVGGYHKLNDSTEPQVTAEFV